MLLLLLLVRVVIILGPHRMKLGNYPADYSCKECIRNLSAVRKVDFLQSFGAIRHFQDSLPRDIPDAFHDPAFDIVTAEVCQRREALIGYVEAMGNVHRVWSVAYKRRDAIDQHPVVDHPVVWLQVEDFA